MTATTHAGHCTPGRTAPLSTGEASRSRLSRPLAASCFALLAAGCATITDDHGLSEVNAKLEPRIGQQVPRPDDAGPSEETLRTLLAQPLGAEDAVRVALLNSPRLRGALAELKLAEADLVQAQRMRNPGFSFSRLTQGPELEIERRIIFDVAGLLTLPIRAEIEGRRFERAKLVAAMDVLDHAAQTRRAWYTAVAAQQSLGYARQVREAAEAGAELARRMAAVGNFNRLEQARHQTFYAEASLQLARAEQTQLAERERLTRLMGLWGREAAFTLPERLPELPQAPREIAEVEAAALRERLDVQAAKLEIDGLAKSLELTRVTRVLNVLELGFERDSTWEGSERLPRKSGYEVEIQIPIFDWGEAKVARAEAVYMQAAERLRDTAVSARSEAREAYLGYRTAFDVARHYRDEIVPLRKLIVDESLLRYNGMLGSVFELLADARVHVGTVAAYIEAQRDFWIADTDLSMTLSGKSPGALRRASAAMPAAASGGTGGH